MQVACVMLLRTLLSIGCTAFSGKGWYVSLYRLKRICCLEFLQEELLRSNRVIEFKRSLLLLLSVPLVEVVA